MSTNVYWEPIGDARYLGKMIKEPLRKRYGSPLDVDLSRDDIPYLEGLRDACQAPNVAKELDDLLDLIAKHGRIRVVERS